MTADPTALLPSATKNKQIGPMDPLTDGFAITPADTDLECVTRALYVGGTGTLVLKMRSGRTVTLSNAAVGWHPVQVIQVMAASTATGIVGMI